MITDLDPVSPPASVHDSPPRRSSLRLAIEVALYFLKLGATTFGGPAAAIAMMRVEIVGRRKWVSEQRFLDLLGASNLTPGSTSTKLAMYLGSARTGPVGLILAGVGLVLPAMLMMLVLAVVYVHYGTTPAAGWLLYGIKPVIIPLIALALWNLGKQAVKSTLTGLAGIAALALYGLGANPVILLVGIGLGVMLSQNAARLKAQPALLPLPLIGTGLAVGASSFSLGAMFLVFLKIGAVLFGSGYVLFAFLHADLVERHAWLTEQQLIDAIAIGQMMPGPLSNAATFIGYLLGGVPGALLATVGIYLPAFILVAISSPLIPRLRRSVWASAFLDGVNVAALGLMAGVTWKLARAAFPDAYAVLVGLIAAVLLLRFKIGSVWLVLCGAAMGLLSAVV